MSETKFNSRYHNAGTSNDPVIREEPSKTKQEFAEEADLNTIMRRYERQGLAPADGNRQPMFGDFSAPELRDYAAALNTVEGTRELMQRMPAKVRQRFHNNPVDLILFAQDPKNLEEAYALGILRDDYKSPSAPPATPPAPPEAKK